MTKVDIKKMIEEAEVNRNLGVGERYTFDTPTKRGGKLVVDISLCETPEGSQAIPRLWVKHGYMDRVVPHYWNIDTYAYDEEGNSYRSFDPQLTKKLGGTVINFDWIFEATKENKQKLLEEVLRLAYY